MLNIDRNGLKLVDCSQCVCACACASACVRPYLCPCRILHSACLLEVSCLHLPLLLGVSQAVSCQNHRALLLKTAKDSTNSSTGQACRPSHQVLRFLGLPELRQNQLKASRLGKLRSLWIKHPHCSRTELGPCLTREPKKQPKTGICKSMPT